MLFVKNKITVAILLVSSSLVYADQQLEQINVTAEQQLKQSLGVSKLSAEQISKSAVTNDISELVRKMPGVNLTGNTATGQRGNNRQIDIRGMGPENTLILIDGKPVSSRNSVRYSWRGQRDTRGDSNWVPAEEIESIEVLRGPAAARYGSGAAGGVVNITTKKISEKLSGALTYYTNQPFDRKEGATHRVGFNLNGPLADDVLSFRLYGSANKTDADAQDINTLQNGSNAAGREGVRNRDIAGRLAWKINPQQLVTVDASYSRQGNIYAGDTQHNNPTELTENLYGSETNRMYRRNYSIMHQGDWSWGTSKLTGSYEYTTNSRLLEGLAGGPEGRISELSYDDSKLKNSRLAGEISVPFEWGVPQVVTFGAEFNHDSLQDPASMRQTFADRAIFVGLENLDKGKTAQDNFSAFVENNLLLSDKINLIPAVRFDRNSRSGSKVSPGLNAFYHLNDNWTLKGGVAQAYKAPNLYQSTPGYLLFTRGNGCPIGNATQCYLMGNDNLKPETSINKELGVEYNLRDWSASFAWFRNDYRHKIAAGKEFVQSVNGYQLLEWTNVPRAVVEGLEGSFTVPLTEDLKWSNNFTYMLQSKDKSTGNPLSIIPKYTINTFLDWQITPQWDTQLSATFYGRQKPRQYAENRTEAGMNTTGDILDTSTAIGSYTLVGLNTGYKINKNIDVRLGINNIFNKKLYRSGAGAATYNESGTAVYGKLSVSF
ncbi:TonB-dependent siderophore receptor [Testudinibacter sp. TR-2022]|uniref:FepA family TonB-dependent siderophore receptor n=1 Tax=Testudinibacter sp. TR-2022 TaxID=2585029 RepID=UPI00111A3129|nr:FepA family TonB-dependent siderophore receptor [Testudinibacter sp. TR-2022]TNH04853.1 TonB-dependent siderophore receptor [Pasteurellaceae bacterium Phil31]TNH08298.1 TonB-dependent siderophore receptor [Testudinibacter sp. TR-2022]TNH11171.1 TonB-dependent siderophore receptor [Testudinibacter sp. TR-2022]TNH11808.1 TonB-dependent siderophore receptor [Testudinibacter sp. TR-2022]TNH18338.1 TonB-dependent siderophore receptor [Testudinibacter sp. TR-2022]